MKLFSTFPHSSGLNTGGRRAILALGIVIFGSAGTLLVQAADNPEILKVMQEFNRPIRRAVEPYMPRPDIRLPQMFRAPSYQPLQALGYAPHTERLQPLPRFTPESGYTGARQRPVEKRKTAIVDDGISHGAVKSVPHLLTSRTKGRGAPVATNYCVRLCDGFAFPVGNVGTGAWNAQEAACRSACPSAQTALFSAPAGAKDFDSLSRGGLRYASLQNAFQYREKFSDTCTCRPVGATQSTAAILSDLTLRHGDIVMTRVGVRHFDGANRFPYHVVHFSDALTKLTSKREIAVMRAMEVASIRGIHSIRAFDNVRTRVVTDVRPAEKIAARAPATATTGLAQGFAELTARERLGAVAMPAVRRPHRLVALN